MPRILRLLRAVLLCSALHRHAVAVQLRSALSKYVPSRGRHVIAPFRPLRHVATRIPSLLHSLSVHPHARTSTTDDDNRQRRRDSTDTHFSSSLLHTPTLSFNRTALRLFLRSEVAPLVSPFDFPPPPRRIHLLLLHRAAGPTVVSRDSHNVLHAAPAAAPVQHARWSPLRIKRYPERRACRRARCQNNRTSRGRRRRQAPQQGGGPCRLYGLNGLWRTARAGSRWRGRWPSSSRVDPPCRRVHCCIVCAPVEPRAPNISRVGFHTRARRSPQRGASSSSTTSPSLTQTLTLRTASTKSTLVALRQSTFAASTLWMCTHRSPSSS